MLHAPPIVLGAWINVVTQLPFEALVGLDLAQQALLLLAVEPRLKGLVLAAAAGTGKSSLARGMHTLLGDVPFVELPPGIDVENLIGGLDLEATLRLGRVTLQPGVLARAHGGAAYVDGINLLPDGAANLLLTVLDDEEVRIEREGVSRRTPARFTLIGSYDPAEGPPRRHLLDRLGLLAPLPGNLDAERRAQIIRHNLQTTQRDWEEERAFYRGLVITAREQLPLVTISAQQLRKLSATALAYGVEGHRVDLFAMRAACASAALNFRSAVEDEDLELAARLVILPRATQTPPPPPAEAPPPPQPEAAPPEADTADPDPEDAAAPPQLGPTPEQILEALEATLPTSLEELPFQNLRRGRAGSRGTTAGKRGRHVRSIPGDPRRARIDIVATLRAAAPWQPLRRDRPDARHANGKANGHLPHGDAHPNGHAAPPASAERPRPRLEMGDVRVKQYRSKAGALFCFAVDASGSMALHRMRQAKGAVNALLEKAYVNRDRVSLIAFRGQRAELLMAPTQSVELARRALDLLPTGGGTPLASALLLAIDVAEQARRRGILQTMLIVLTDGRANIGLREGSDVQSELQQLGRHIAASPLHVVIVDTQRNYLGRGEAQRLAEWLAAEYAYLPNAGGEQIADLARQSAAERR